MRSVFVTVLLCGVALAQEAHVTIAPLLDPTIPSGVPVVADAPLAVSNAAQVPVAPLTLTQPIEVAEPIVLPQDLEERQDTVVRQTSSSGKLQHILRAHYVGQIDNEQTFEAQDAAEPAALPKTPRVSLNDLYFAAQQPAAVPVPAAAPVAAAPLPVPAPYPSPYGYPPYPYAYPGLAGPTPYGLPYNAGFPFAAPAAPVVPAAKQ